MTPSLRFRRNGFTLVELIVAMVLMTAILAATWSMLNSFRDRFDKSQMRVARSQVVRAVQQSLEADLRHAQVPRPRRNRRGAAPGFGLRDAAARPRDMVSETATSSRDRSTNPPVNAGTQNGQALSELSNSTGETRQRSAVGSARPISEASRATRELTPTLSNERAEQPSLSADAVLDQQSPSGTTPRAATGGGLARLNYSDSEQIAVDEWHVPELRWFGTSTALLMDVVQPAEMPAESQVGPGVEDMQRLVGPAIVPAATRGENESAEIPDTIRRVVYLFTDPASAVREGRLAGLVRCELSLRDLVVLRSRGGAARDLFTLLTPRLSETPIDPELGQQLQDLALQDHRRTDARADATEIDSAGLPGKPLLEMNDPLLSDLPWNPILDAVPEIASFRLRYFDGAIWHDTWDATTHEDMPVAVEVRFQLAHEIHRRLQRAQTADASDNTTLLDSPDVAANSPFSDNMRTNPDLEGASPSSNASSDQTGRPIGASVVNEHRYLITLRAAPAPVADESSPDPSTVPRGQELVR